MEVWTNTDDGAPIPAWMDEVACRLPGGRFAVETRAGTMIAGPGDIIIRYRDGEAGVIRIPAGDADAGRGEGEGGGA
jgi:hypothetical protein